jgi:hypothetical protein
MAWDLLEKSGFTSGAWEYNEPNMAYNQDRDLDTLASVTYNSMGTENSWTNTNKS